MERLLRMELRPLCPKCYSILSDGTCPSCEIPVKKPVYAKVNDMVLVVRT